MSTAGSLSRQAGASRWWNIAFILLALLEVLFTVSSIGLRGLFDHVGVDYRTFYCSAQIAVTAGFSQVYDPALTLQEQCQRQLYATYARGPLHAGYATVPTPYMPPFILAFVPFTLLPPVPSFILWTLLNLVLLLLYLRRFLRALGQGDGLGLPLRVTVSFLAFITLFLGQVNILLLVFLGEGLLAWARGREFRTGLWLAGLLLKPQLLILLVPALFIGRRFKVLAGFAAASAVVGILSLLSAGLDGLLTLGRLILLYPAGLATTAPEWMMNWRGLATNLSGLVPPQLAWGIAWAGLAATAGVGLALWLRPPAPASPRFAVALLGTTAATCAVTWHAHSHMALPLAVLLLYLAARLYLSPHVVNLWLVAPGLLYFVAMLAWPQMAPSLLGLAMLAGNVCLLLWAAVTLWRRQDRTGAGQTAPDRALHP